jgi:uncharacterized protein (TIGR02118 family)
MIKVSIFYPHKADGHFDLDYYVNTHMPMAINRLGPTLRGVTVEYGMGGGLPDSPPPFVAMCHFLFDSVEAFQAAFAPHAEELVGDIPNYTNIETVIQFSDVKISQ